MTVRISDWRLLGALLAAFFAAGMVGGPGTTVDETMSQAAATWRGAAPAFTDFAKSFTEVGGGRLTLSLTALTALSLLIRRRFWLALLLVVTVLAERELVEWLKELTARPRPIFEAINPLSLAYPSGHAANSMTAFLAVAMLAVPAAYRRPVVIAALTLSFLVGLSRIYLGVHWPSDVIGGWALGLMAAGLAITIAERSALLRHEPEHEVVGGHRLAGREDESA